MIQGLVLGVFRDNRLSARLIDSFVDTLLHFIKDMGQAVEANHLSARDLRVSGAINHFLFITKHMLLDLSEAIWDKLVEVHVKFILDVLTRLTAFSAGSGDIDQRNPFYLVQFIFIQFTRI